MPSLRRLAARALDVLAVVVLAVALVRFGWPAAARVLHGGTSPAPPVRLATLNGRRFDLGARRGRFVVLDFYATWCEPCRDSLPLVERFARAHPQAEVVPVDVGEPLALARPFAAQFRLGDVALDPDVTAARAFAVDGYPTIVAIDAGGTIRARWIGYDPGIERALGEALARWGPRTVVSVR